MKPLNLFYEEPNPDRWIKFDRYPRKIIRRLVRGEARPGGVMMVALELMRGLDRLKIPYRFNDYRYAKNNPTELIGVIGKPHLIFEKRFENPILFGAGIFSHPIDSPDFFNKYSNVKKMLVPGPWMEKMCKSFYGDKVIAWPVGIDAKTWNISSPIDKKIDFLIYDKIRWEHNRFESELINPIVENLNDIGLSYDIIRYGNYTPSELSEILNVCKAAIFLCEHETQGIAYQQILSTNTPILAWDRGGFWQDPSYYPYRVRYEPVTSVPYWDDRCGEKFTTLEDFYPTLIKFNKNVRNQIYEPRNYILENLTLEICAQKYVNIYKDLS